MKHLYRSTRGFLNETCEKILSLHWKFWLEDNLPLHASTSKDSWCLKRVQKAIVQHFEEMKKSVTTATS
jgi:hypothetical protein